MFSERACGTPRAALFSMLERTWAAASGGAGWALRARARAERWTTSGRSRVVIVAPHPDDETVGAGGVAALHVRAGDAVTIVVVTDGGGSRALGLPRAEMVRRRAREVRAAAEVLGAGELRCLGLPEWEWSAREARARLAAPLSDAEIVYAPSCVDYHPEHVRVARVTATLLRPGQVVRVCELGVPLTPLLANRVADTSEVEQARERALTAFVTQAATLEPLRRLADYRARFYGIAAAEVFWEMDSTDYARVVALGDWSRGASPYRGIRARPLTDPLSAFAGMRARIALRRIARRHA